MDHAPCLEPGRTSPLARCGHNVHGRITRIRDYAGDEQALAAAGLAT